MSERGRRSRGLEPDEQTSAAPAAVAATAAATIAAQEAKIADLQAQMAAMQAEMQHAMEAQMAAMHARMQEEIAAAVKKQHRHSSAGGAAAAAAAGAVAGALGGAAAGAGTAGAPSREAPVGAAASAAETLPGLHPGVGGGDVEARIDAMQSEVDDIREDFGEQLQGVIDKVTVSVLAALEQSRIDTPSISAPSCGCVDACVWTVLPCGVMSYVYSRATPVLLLHSHPNIVPCACACVWPTWCRT